MQIDLIIEDLQDEPYTIGCVTIPDNMSYEDAIIKLDELWDKWVEECPRAYCDSEFVDWLNANSEFKKWEGNRNHTLPLRRSPEESGNTP